MLALRAVLAASLLPAAGCGGGAAYDPQPPAPSLQHLYVDAAAGNDANPGTAARPLRSVAAALAAAGAGTTVYLAAGDYRSQGPLLIRHTGREGAPLRVQGAPGGTARVEAVVVSDSEWVEVVGLVVVGPKTLPAAWRDMPAVVVDDPSVVIDLQEDWSTRVHKVNRKYASYAHFASGGVGGSWEDDFSAGINVVASRRVTLRGNDVSLHTACVQLRNQSSEVLVEANTLHHCLDALRGALRLQDAYSFARSTVRANVVRQTFREGLRLNDGAQHNLVEGNRVEYTGHSHIATYHAGGHNVVRGNDVRHGGYYSETMRFPGSSGISLHTAGAGTVADGNRVSYQVDPTLRDGNGVIIDYTPEQATVVNNLVYRTMGSGITSVMSGRASIVHNTIVEAGFETPSRHNGVGVRIVSAGDVGNIIANNLIHRPRIGGILFEQRNLAQQAVLDHNLFDMPGLPLVGDGLDAAAAYTTLAALRAVGACLNCLAADARLALPEEGRLAADSPALGRGTPLHSAAHDIDGLPRSAVAPTIGARER